MILHFDFLNVSKSPNNSGSNISHPIELNTNEKLDQRLDYVHNNPVVADIVRHPEDYLYSRQLCKTIRKFNGGYVDLRNVSLSAGLRTPSEKTETIVGTSEPPTSRHTTPEPVTALLKARKTCARWEEYSKSLFDA